MTESDYMQKLLEIKNGKTVLRSLQQIEKKHEETHSSQIPILVKYLKRLPIDENKREYAQKLISLEERIFWTIDDTIDQRYRFIKEERELEYHNEVVKFITFMEMMSVILRNQMRTKRDLLRILLGKPTTSELLLTAIMENIVPLVEIPYNEKLIEEKILREHDPKDLTNLVIDNQLNRAQNIKIYLSTIEAITATKIPKTPFLMLRAVQLIREDLEEIRLDRRRRSNNIALILQKKFGKWSQAKREIEKVLGQIMRKLEEQKDPNLDYLPKAALNETLEIKKLMSGASL